MWRGASRPRRPAPGPRHRWWRRVLLGGLALVLLLGASLAALLVVTPSVSDAPARVAWVTVTGAGPDPGGSTLSQQLVKQLYTHGRSTLADDAEQVALAVKLNLGFSKAQILRMYAGTVYFGHGFHGLHDAACGYFAVPPARLTLAQASLLAGLVQAPSADDPLTHPAQARARAGYVLARLVATGKITPAASRAAARVALHLARPAATCPG